MRIGFLCATEDMGNRLTMHIGNTALLVIRQDSLGPRSRVVLLRRSKPKVLARMRRAKRLHVR